MANSNAADLLLKIDATTEGLRRELKKADAAINKGTQAIDRNTKRIDRSFKQTGQAAVRLGGTLAAAFGVREIVAYADAWQNATNQLKTVQKEGEILAHTQEKLMRVSNNTRSGFEATAGLYTRLTRSTESLNLSQQETIDLTETINKSFAVSGATAQEATNAITQLSQGLAAGALRGDEFNSVSEQSPILMQAIADSLNMTKGELRSFAAEGGITAEIVVKALQEASGEIDATFSNMSATFGQNLTVAKNNMLSFIGDNELLQDSISVSGDGLVLLSESIDDLGFAAVLAGTAITAKYIPAVAAMAGPLGIAAGLVTGLVLAMQNLDKISTQAAENALDWIEGTGGLQSLDLEIVRLTADLAKQAEILDKTRVSMKNFGATSFDVKREEQKLVKIIAEFNKVTDRRVSLQDKMTSEQEEAENETSELAVTTSVLNTELGIGVIKMDHTTESLLDMSKVMTSLRTGHIPGLDTTFQDLNARIEQTKFRMIGVSDAAKVLEKDNDQTARAAEEAWGRTHDYLSRTFVDIFENGKGAFSQIAEAFSSMIKRMVAEWAASGLMRMIGFGGTTSSGSGNPLSAIFSGAASNVVGGSSQGGGSGIGSSGGLNVANTSRAIANAGTSLAGAAGFGSASTTGGWVAPNMATNATLNAAGGSGVTGGISATNWGSNNLVNAGAGLVAGYAGGATGSAVGEAVFNKEAESGIATTVGGVVGSLWGPLGTFVGSAIGGVIDVAAGGDGFERANEGFLLSSVGNGSNQFDGGRFDSGFSPVGFSRNGSQAGAMAVIDSFRGVDSLLTGAAKSAGLNVSLSPTSFGGYDEEANGNGLYFGASNARGAAPLDEQLGRYASQWITAVGKSNGVSQAVIDSAIGGGAIAGILERASAAVDGSHKMGLSRVPFDGYIAELHKNEEVLREDDPRNVNSSGDSSMLSELRKVSAAVQKTSDLLIRVTRDGDYLLTGTA